MFVEFLCFILYDAAQRSKIKSEYLLLIFLRFSEDMIFLNFNDMDAIYIFFVLFFLLNFILITHRPCKHNFFYELYNYGTVTYTYFVHPYKTRGYCVCTIRKPSCSVDENRTPRLLCLFARSDYHNKTVTSDSHARGPHGRHEFQSSSHRRLGVCDQDLSCECIDDSYTRASHVLMFVRWVVNLFHRKIYSWISCDSLYLP